MLQDLFLLRFRWQYAHLALCQQIRHIGCNWTNPACLELWPRIVHAWWTASNNTFSSTCWREYEDLFVGQALSNSYKFLLYIRSVGGSYKIHAYFWTAPYFLFTFLSNIHLNSERRLPTKMELFQLSVSLLNVQAGWMTFKRAGELILDFQRKYIPHGLEFILINSITKERSQNLDPVIWARLYRVPFLLS